MHPCMNFGNINSSNIPTANHGTPRSTRKATSAARRLPEQDPLDLFREKNSFNPKTLRKLLQKTLRAYGIAGRSYNKTQQAVLSEERDGCIHSFSIYFNITENEEENISVEFEGFQGLKRVKHPNFRIQRVTSWDQLEVVLHFYTGRAAGRSKDSGSPQAQNSGTTFVERQVQLGNLPRNIQMYNIKDLTLAFSWFVRSRALYVELRKHMILPSPTTLRRITRIAKNTSDQQIFTNIFNNLEEHDRVCVLIVDEVYVKSSVTYSGGQIFGLSKDNPNEPAKTILSIMVKCCHSKKKFIAKMIPVHKLNARLMFDCVVDIIFLLQDCGFRIISIINENNKVNQKLFSLFNCFNILSPWIVRNPADPSKPIFLVYDPIHIIKNIRNNFIQEKSKTLVFLDPDSNEEVVAKWSDVEELHRHEDGHMTLLCLSKLTRASVYPTHLEKQEVQLALDVFCEQTVSALMSSSISTDSMKSTAKAILLVVRLFKVLNVKSAFTTKRLNDPDRVALDDTESGQRGFKILSDWIQIANFMCPKSAARCQQLTKDTSGAIKWTCESLLCLAHYLLHTNEAFKFQKVCLGAFTQDDLDRHFGYFRMVTGSTYHISVQDIFATHNIDRARLMLKNTESDYLDEQLSAHSCHECKKSITPAEQHVIDDMVISGVEGRLSSDEEMAVYMLAGYIAFKHPELRGTSSLPSDMTAFFEVINRGKLSRPCDNLLHLVLLAINFFKESNSGHCRTRLSNIFATFPRLFSIDISVTKKGLHRLCNCILKRYAIKSGRDFNPQPARKVAKLASTTSAVPRH